jgi:glycosyltransferase involved in cell wall biosynthesis
VNPWRVVIVARRFWPLVGGPEKVLANLAVELSARGCPTMVLTARWQPRWPDKISLHGVPVIRLAPPAESGLGNLPYLRRLASWLRHNRQRYDLVYVSQLRQEAYAAMRAVGRQTPVVLRAERFGRGGDCQWQHDVFCGRRIASQCRRAAALIAPTPEVMQELLAAGYSRSLVHGLPNGVPDVPPRTRQTRLAARAMLAEANPELELPEAAPLALYIGRLELGCGLQRLLEAWETILRRRPNARLWLVGEGSRRRALRRQIETLNLGSRVSLVGVFDQVDALLAAADVFLRPISEAGTGLALLEASAAGLPVVASDIPGHRDWIEDGHNGLLAPADVASWALAIDRLLEEPELAARLGQTARQKAADYSLANMVGMHLTLFQGLRA